MEIMTIGDMRRETVTKGGQIVISFYENFGWWRPKWRKIAEVTVPEGTPTLSQFWVWGLGPEAKERTEDEQ